MSFEAVWGFDPEAVLKAHKLFRGLPDVAGDKPDEQGERYSEQEGDARIPSSQDSQIYELRRMFRL